MVWFVIALVCLAFVMGLLIGRRVTSRDPELHLRWFGDRLEIKVFRNSRKLRWIWLEWGDTDIVKEQMVIYEGAWRYKQKHMEFVAAPSFLASYVRVRWTEMPWKDFNKGGVIETMIPERPSTPVLLAEPEDSYLKQI